MDRIINPIINEFDFSPQERTFIKEFVKFHVAMLAVDTIEKAEQLTWEVMMFVAYKPAKPYTEADSEITPERTAANSRFMKVAYGYVQNRLKID